MHGRRPSKLKHAERVQTVEPATDVSATRIPWQSPSCRCLPGAAREEQDEFRVYLQVPCSGICRPYEAL